jgi:chaperonin cofactor prefoldin
VLGDTDFEAKVSDIIRRIEKVKDDLADPDKAVAELEKILKKRVQPLTKAIHTFLES